ncbi:type VI secretion system ATPase TssH [Endozoicomonas arenosclerae]|uniref:type VI secretion system ATPase TssH n=1 Tax=Endozoicomonas arenosclerae TaxID=1633495 RepID=UPI000785FE14|nr:type VI secretion system ATPase TssH [Endozoicomonas arenosclerae]
MKQLDLKKLISLLGNELKLGLEEAAALCVKKKHRSIEIDHWLMQLFRSPGDSMQTLIRTFGISAENIIEEIENRMMSPGSADVDAPSLSAETVSLIQDAWLTASVNFDDVVIMPAHLLLALMDRDSLALNNTRLGEELQKISKESLKSLAASEVPERTGERSAKAEAGTTALNKYTTSMTEEARKTPSEIVGRDQEIRQILDILCRRRQNNPILVGDPGVGKTAVVEGFAQQVVEGRVPKQLKGIEIRSLDLGLLQAGASIKGEFESRLKDVITEVKQSPHPVIVFIDEAHTLIGAGGTAGQNDAANLLKPALARGEFRTIAATTWAEYKKFFEKDAALTRRFQPVKVPEPDEQTATQMTRQVARVLEQHHGVRVHDEAVSDAVKLSVRYLPERQLPDKSISLLDTACSRVSLSQNTTPAKLQKLQEQQQFIHSELTELKRDQTLGADLSERIAELEQALQSNQQISEQLEQRWLKEKELACKLFEMERTLDQSNESETTDNPVPATTEELRELANALREIQGEDPMVLARVDAGCVATVIADWTGIPAGKVLKDDIQRLLDLESSLHERVIGQDRAITAISESIRTGRAGLSDPRRPIGVFLMCGPSGVGKTETALAIADQLYGGEHNLTVINMTEFKEEHKVSMLLGAPAGYVGYGEGGVLTEAIRRIPFSVLLLDEMEKAHPGVHDIFYQVFDKGMITDSEGREIDFRNTIIIMTTNAADSVMCDLATHQDLNSQPAESFMPQVQNELLHFFKPAFLGRVNVVPYFPLNDQDLEKICRLSLKRIGKNLREQYGATLSVDDEVVQQLVAWNVTPESGARAIEQQITRKLLPSLASECLSLMAVNEKIHSVRISLDGQTIRYFLNES